MSTVIAVLSGKGGTGKSTAAAALGCALAELGHTVLCVDGDTELRNLDLCLGLGDTALMDYGDVLEGRCTPEKAMIAPRDFSSLRLLAAPPGKSSGLLRDLIPTAKRSFDYCIIDCPGGLGGTVEEAAALADLALVVTTPDPCGHRDGERAAQLLRDSGDAAGRLLINRVNPRLLRTSETTLDDTIDLVGMRLLGYAPEDPQVPLALSAGRPLLAEDHRPKRGAAAAFRRMARRLTGERVPLP